MQPHSLHVVLVFVAIGPVEAVEEVVVVVLVVVVVVVVVVGLELV